MLGEAANNLTKLVEVGKHFTKFAKSANIFAKFLGFANNFFEVYRSCEQLYKVCGTW